MGTTNWDEKLPCRKSKPVQHTVGETELDFYPVTVGAMLFLKDSAKIIGKAFAVLFTSTRDDVGSVRENTASKTQTGERDLVTMSEPIKPELAKLRLESKKQAVDDILTTLFDEKNLKNSGYLIMDSLRGVFPKKPSDAEQADFIATMDVPRLVEFFTGVVKANKGLFGPLTVSLGGQGFQAIAKQAVESKLAEMGVTLGENSKIRSPGSSSEATTTPSPLLSMSSPDSTSPVTGSKPEIGSSAPGPQ